jgi:hypothetical protein
VRRKVVKLALKETELSPRELAETFTDRESYFVSEASTYRTLKAHDLITNPAFIVIKAENEFKDKTTAINQLWQTDFTYLRIIGWGGFISARSWMITAATLSRRSTPAVRHIIPKPKASPLLSYDLSSSCAKLEQLPGTAIMLGRGGGRTVPLLVNMDRL